MNKNINGSDLTFEQDNLISFDEATHTYSVDGKELTPVSNVVSQFFTPFDAERISIRKCHGDKNAARILRDEWAAAGQMASQAGTFLHKQIEDYISQGITPETLECVTSYKGESISEEKIVDISKEWQYFLDFSRNVEFTPFRTEWKVFDLDARIAGTIDLLCTCPDGTYEIYDWKRSKKVNPNEINRFSRGLNGLGHLTDTPYVHYCLQQNLYRHILETNYGIKISAMHLVVLHPEKTAYEVVNIDRMDSEVETILKYSKSCR